MDINVWTAIIAASSAIIGSAVPSIITYLSQKANFKNQIAQKNYDIKAKEYNEFLQTMQDFMNNTNSSQHFYSYQNAVNKVLLIADNDTAIYINQYFQAQIKGANERDPLDAEKHIDFQTKIVNSIRKDMGISNENLDKILMVSYNIPNKAIDE